ncbi:MAG: glycosyltransferase [Chloroflexi bacterium]|nr:glycosyltransferase [Chloroflexota bacterium]
MTSSPMPFVSVVVPVFNDPDGLRACLEALEGQTYPKALYEVIVVDNGSARDVGRITARFGRVRRAHEPVPGSYAARNRGISLARGDVIAFIDADCRPDRDWIEQGLEHLLRAPNCGLVAGRIEPSVRDPRAPTAAEVYDALTAFDQRELVEKRRAGAAGNVFTFRAVIEHAGVFDETLRSGSDILWGQRVSALGYRVVYADDARVRHRALRSVGALCRRIIRLVGGQHDRQRRAGGSPGRVVADIARDLVPPVRWAWRLSRERGLDAGTRVKVVGILWLLRYRSAWERLRLQFGGTSRR